MLDVVYALLVEQLGGDIEELDTRLSQERHETEVKSITPFESAYRRALGVA